jgi:hypothetical protein
VYRRAISFLSLADRVNNEPREQRRNADFLSSYCGFLIMQFGQQNHHGRQLAAAVHQETQELATEASRGICGLMEFL